MTPSERVTAPSREMPQEVSTFLRAHADEYRHAARAAGCTLPYPADNTCQHCGRASHRPLVPFRLGWHCKNCAYPSDPDQREETPPSVRVRTEGGAPQRCSCGERLLAPISQQRGYCERCRLAGKEAS